ncbi:hypothetical protein L6452_06003 [Arctium lappa]|uniref:Uncharacterized protein n=1 Tax=Arctium lappa TaxID=4217 RepID=A0ACB9EI82_ARCLA|nr:hypothetical protein L6452_06003 [Arctium lappa]
MPAFRYQYKDVSVNNMGAHVAGLSFMALEAGLVLNTHLDNVRRLVPTALAKEQEALARATEVEAKAKAVEDKREEYSVHLDDTLNHLEEASNEKEELRERLKATLGHASTDEAELETSKVHTTLMRRHLKGQNPLVSVEGELAFFLGSVGVKKDLDSEDEQELESGEEVSQGGDIKVASQQEQKQSKAP